MISCIYSNRLSTHNPKRPHNIKTLPLIHEIAYITLLSVPQQTVRVVNFTANAGAAVLPSAMVIWRQFQVLSFKLGAKPPHAEVNGKSQLQCETNSNPLVSTKNVPVIKLFHFHLSITVLFPESCNPKVELLLD